MPCVNGFISMVVSPGYGLRGDAPNGDYVPPPPTLTTITFDGIADGSSPPQPLTVLAGTFEVRDEELRATGTQPPPEDGYAWIITADAGVSEGVIRCVYNANGGAGDESGLLVRGSDANNFFDIITFGSGTLALVDITAGTPGDTDLYSIPSWDANTDYLVEVACWNDFIYVFVDGVLAITRQTSTRQTATQWGFKFGGTVAGFDSVRFPHAYVDPITIAKPYLATHSLLVHDGTGSDQFTRAPNWMGLIAAEAGTDFATAGEFGQLFGGGGINDNWATNGVPTSSQLGFDFDTYTAWPSGTFAEQDFSHVVCMPSNFQQNEDATLRTADFTTLIDNVRGQEPFPQFLMHLHWPEPSETGSIVDPANLTPAEFATYKTYTRTTFATWYQTLYRSIVEARPNVDMRVIPCGLIIFDMIDNLPYLSAVTFTDLFMDDAGHGTQTTYFLVALIFHRAIYGTTPDLTNFTFPAGATQVLQAVRDNLQAINVYAAQRLEHYHQNGFKVF